jgi:transposase
LALVELSVAEQRRPAVLEVAAGVPVTEVAGRSGVSRQSVHAWVSRYEQGGLRGLMDRSRRPESCPHQVSAEVETAVCELWREHPRWGPLRLAHELGRLGVSPQGEDGGRGSGHGSVIGHATGTRPGTRLLKIV